MLCLSDGYKLVVCSVLEKCGRRAEVGMNEGYRWKKKLFSEQGRMLLEKLALAPWASRRRQVLLELLDRLNPTPEELTAGVEREARTRPEVLRLMTHPGVGPLTALGYVPICLPR
jgi:transposase